AVGNLLQHADRLAQRPGDRAHHHDTGDYGNRDGHHESADQELTGRVAAVCVGRVRRGERLLQRGDGRVDRALVLRATNVELVDDLGIESAGLLVAGDQALQRVVVGDEERVDALEVGETARVAARVVPRLHERLAGQFDVRLVVLDVRDHRFW